MLKKRNLFFQIWFVFSSFTLLTFLLLILILPSVLRPFFTDDVYSRMEEIQSQLPDTPLEHRFSNGEMNDKRIETFYLSKISKQKNGMNKHHQQLPIKVLNKMQSDVKEQKSISQRYKMKINEETNIFYVIKKTDNYILVSYTYSDYRNNLVGSLYTRIIYLLLFVLLLNIPISLLLAKYLSKPLMLIEKHVENISERKWNDSLLLDRKDEIGRLALSIEKLRKRLKKQDEKQQFFMQHVSHELKTPVMVIRGYTEAIKNGVYPTGELQSSMDVIDEESVRLEEKIKNLLYLTKLDYLSEDKLSLKYLRLDRLLNNIISKFECQRSDLTFILNVHNVEILADIEQINIAIENIINNQLRYADKEIKISLSKRDKYAEIKIENDGELVSLSNPNDIFEPFYKGNKGQFGLGLTITKQIIEKHKGTIWVENKDTGVSFLIRLPLYQ